MNSVPSSADTPPKAIHATAVVVREAGVLIRGRSRAGKSSLALALIELGQDRDFHARLVGDDRVFVRALNGRVLVEPHPAILGKIEQRGVGILDVPYQPHAVVRLVVDFAAANCECDIPPRSPNRHEFETMMCGVAVRRMTLRQGIPPGEAAGEVLDTLRGDRTTPG